MFLFYNRRFLVIQLIEILLLLLTDHNGRLTLTKKSTTVAAVTQPKNSTALLPYLQIQKHAITRLTISKPHSPYYLPCVPILTPYNYDQENQPIYCSWYRNDEAVEQLSIRKNDFFIYENGTLRLPTNEKASGEYHCKIEWDESAVISDKITVEYPVLKRIFPGQQQTANISAVENKPLVLSCPFVSVPAARFSWYFGNDSLTNDNSALILSNGTLILRHLRLEQAGKYKCVAQNAFASKTHRQFIWQLRVEPRDTPFYPKNQAEIPETAVSEAQLLPAFQNATVYLPAGGSVLLQCHAVADFVPIVWYLQPPNNKMVRLSNNSVALSITNASALRHEGRYSCITPLETQNFQVIVTTAPRIVSRLPVEVVYIGISMILSCRAEGNPEPSITWYHNGVHLNSSYTRYISGNELHIHSFDPKEEGIYQCVARNVAGEDSATGELRFNQKQERINQLQNIRCYPHSFHSINVTFDSRSLTSMFVVYIVRSNPHSWDSFSPMKLNQTSYVVISTSLPVYEPFVLITRVLFPTTEVRTGTLVPQQMILSSLRSTPVTCCTQGLMLRPIAVGNDTFVKWSQGQVDNKKYFILQFSINHTHPHPAQLLDGRIKGTLTPVEEKADEVRRHLTEIQPLNQSAAATVLRNAEHEVLTNEDDDMSLDLEDDIFSMVVDASVTGILLQRFARIKMRVLIITSENEFLGQDFRYVQWKIIENGTSEQANMPFRLMTIESRALAFKFLDSLNETCVLECHTVIDSQEPQCKERNISNSMLLVTKLKADHRYNLHFSNCKTRIFYGEIDVKTQQDPPGTIKNSKLIKQNGLKLMWEPPAHPNGRIHHYDIRWSLDNVTYEDIVQDCTSCSFKFPNVSETAKIHVAVRVMGDTGAGAPMYFDMVNNNHTWLEEDRGTSHSEVYSGIAIGSLLSIACVFLFGLFIIFQQRNFKARAQGPTHLTTPTDINFGNLSSASGMPGDSAGGLSGGTLQQDCHEMQTLIPRSRYHIELLPEHTLEYQTSSAAVAVVHLANGNGSVQVARRSDQDGAAQGDLGIAGVHNLSQLPLCGGGATSPERKTVQDAMLQEAKAFYIPYRHTPPNVVALGSSKQCPVVGGSELEVIVPPNSLPLVTTMPGLGVAGGGAGGGGGSGGGAGGVSNRRSGSLSSSSASSSSNGSNKKQFHTNFVRHSNSNDGICLLAEEEAAATLTPTSEREYAAVCLTNGFKLPADVAKAGGAYTTNNNNGSSSSSNSNSNSSQKSATVKERQPRGNGNPISFSHNASIVPAHGPVSVNQSTQVKQSWPAATVVHRRAQVDPNG
ncbi:uncharacterized protein LOC128252613 [Drosophila gunungcola]|uniref:uncharacterized protein LOC128252613 n=1 Tax=Drosophila gunungcola TaxID=103775 RepID=UPI0022E5A6C5|nr:uncharacterized protein LOC128252613 [Drosophila gunungcola]XP_052836440.1 uncharacterized protein LOC128252613 [Drosophila gunungcola]XP_052836441.1 uncharacterized protein LOC128252613 [Drosophila gunungcola]XP_052836443.1 uncharacterized protein LOC128252613 [Drosophila gunungcola]XP_052836444.1 uncharacterized protein LOC128252613 [Drosophila gunungcola]